MRQRVRLFWPLPSRKFRRDFSCSQDGAALLEFAIILPVLIVLSIGCIEVGRVLFAVAAIESAVRGGARYLAQVPNPTCRPTCSWGASRAVELTRDQIALNTGTQVASIRVTPIPDLRSDTVTLEAEVDIALIFSGGFGRLQIWTVRISKQEQKIAG